MQGRFLKETEVKDWIKGMNNAEIIRNIDVMSALTDDDNFCECMLIDEIIGLTGLLLEECVERLREKSEDENA